MLPPPLLSFIPKYDLPDNKKAGGRTFTFIPRLSYRKPVKNLTASFVSRSVDLPPIRTIRNNLNGSPHANRVCRSSTGGVIIIG